MHTAERPLSFRGRVQWALTCVALFLLTYGGCLFLTSLRSDVGTFYFDWERHIPFVPWMIWPYLSIDLFFVGAFFVVRQRNELIAMRRRMILALLIAGTCFLLVPLRFAFPTPSTPGLTGAVIAWFKAADQPYNLAPSLHIALRSILWVVYVRHTRGLVRWGVKAWFLMIGLSTLLVYQHHVIDVVAGQLLAMLCFYLVPEQRLHVMPDDAGCRRPKLAKLYAAGAAACLAVAIALRGWAWLAAWPALSLGVVAYAYATGWPDVFRKRGGRLPTSTLAVHWPYLLLRHLAYLIQRRGRTPFSQVTPALWIGRRPTRADCAALLSSGVRTTIDLTAEFSERRALRTGAYANIPILDLTLPDAATLRRAADAIDDAVARGPAYVHCALGYGRAALAAAAYLLRHGGLETAEDAIALLQVRRPGVVFSDRAVELLRNLGRSAAAAHRAHDALLAMPARA